MDSDKLREDIVSPLLKVSTYKGFTLTGPREAIVRKVHSSQSVVIGTGLIGQVDANGAFTQLNFRLLGASPSCLLNACIRLVGTLRLFATGSINDDASVVGPAAWDSVVVGPRRNGL